MNPNPTPSDTPTPRTDYIFGQQAVQERRVGHGAEDEMRKMELKLVLQGRCLFNLAIELEETRDLYYNLIALLNEETINLAAARAFSPTPAATCRDPEHEMDAFWAAQSEWSQATFGTDQERGPIGALKHLAKEVQEALDSEKDGKLDLMELVDCLFLTFDSTRRAGFSYDQLLSKAWEKLRINKARKWSKPTSDEPVEHDRSGEAPTPAASAEADGDHALAIKVAFALYGGPFEDDDPNGDNIPNPGYDNGADMISSHVSRAVTAERERAERLHDDVRQLIDERNTAAERAVAPFKAQLTALAEHSQKCFADLKAARAQLAVAKAKADIARNTLQDAIYYDSEDPLPLDEIIVMVIAQLAEARKDGERLDWLCDSYAAAGMNHPEAEAESRCYEQTYAGLKRMGQDDRKAVRSAIDAARERKDGAK
jgi:dATP/dGTP diphosphohydrolase